MALSVACLAPTQSRSDRGQNCFQNMNIVSNPQLVRHGQQQRVCRGNRLVFPQLLDQNIRLCRVATAENRPYVVDDGNLVVLLRSSPEKRAITIVH